MNAQRRITAMNVDFDWSNSSAITQDQKDAIEKKIRDFFEDTQNDKYKPCHSGAVTAKLNIDGPLLTNLVGYIKCICGKKYVTVKGKCDESPITYDLV
jgi:hypothetical protein